MAFMQPSLRSNDLLITFVLLILFVSGVGFTMWHLNGLQSQLNERTALVHAKLYAEAIAEFRTLYTREVVETVRDQGIAVTHDYEDREGKWHPWRRAMACLFVSDATSLVRTSCSALTRLSNRLCG